jgi:hypothetical protein
MFHTFVSSSSKTILVSAPVIKREAEFQSAKTGVRMEKKSDTSGNIFERERQGNEFTALKTMQ